jgi:hypothetical protein
MIRTGWLPSALGPGQEDDEAKERFEIETEHRSTSSSPGFEVRLSGEYQNVVKALVEWWDSGDEEGDLEFLKFAVSEIEIFDAEKDQILRELAEANAALNAAVDAESEARRAVARAQDRLVEVRGKLVD